MMNLFTHNEFLVTEREINTFSYKKYVKKNEVRCDGPLYQLLDYQVENCDVQFDEVLATSIKYGKIEILQSMYIPILCFCM